MVQPLHRSLFGGWSRNLSVEAPYERMPLFVKEGSIIPVGPEIQYTDEKKGAPIDIYVYTGKDAAFKLYEDEGTTYAYEGGEFSTIEFTYTEEDGNSLVIGNSKRRIS